MSNLRYNDRRDANEREIIDTLEAVGCSVNQLKGVTGMPDLLVGRGGRMWLLEVKDGNGKLSPSQDDWHRAWRGPAPHVVRTPEEALRAISCV